MEGERKEGREGGKEGRKGSIYLRKEVEGGLTVSACRGEGVWGQAALREGDLGEKGGRKDK